MALADAVKKNDYSHTNIVEGGKRTVVLRIFCSTQGCTETQDVKLGPATNQEIADKAFRRKGWRLGKDRWKDVCPTCQKKEIEERQKQREASQEKAVEQEVQIGMVDEDGKLAMKAEPSSERERLLAEFLQSVIVIHPTDNRLIKYIRGYSDQKVLDEMKGLLDGLSHDEVKGTRTRFFGQQFWRQSPKMKAEAKAKESATILRLVQPDPQPVAKVVEAVAQPAPQENSEAKDKLELRVKQLEAGFQAMVGRVNELTEDNDRMQEQLAKQAKMMIAAKRLIKMIIE